MCTFLHFRGGGGPHLTEPNAYSRGRKWVTSPTNVVLLCGWIRPYARVFGSVRLSWEIVFIRTGEWLAANLRPILSANVWHISPSQGGWRDISRRYKEGTCFLLCTDPSIQDYDERPAVPKITVVFQNSIVVYRKEYNGLIMYYIIIMTTRINRQFLFLRGLGEDDSWKKTWSKKFRVTVPLMAAISSLWNWIPEWLN
jgi:hypothetical protein